MNTTKEGHKELLLRSGATIDLQKEFGTNNCKIGISLGPGLELHGFSLAE